MERRAQEVLPRYFHNPIKNGVKYCVDLIRSKGLEKINLDDLVEELLPKGRALVPTKVKEDLLARIKNYLDNDPDYKRLTGY